MNLDLLHKVLVESFPARAPMASLEYVEVTEKRAGVYGVVIRLVVWDVNKETGVQSIRDVKEQEVSLKVPQLDLATIARIGEFVRALVRVASQAIQHTDVECYMPADFIDFSPLKLAKSNTETEFVAALSMPSRLGKYLAPAQT
jgi:hypothetical protein